MHADQSGRRAYFLFGQFMTEQLAQFSASSFSMPKGIISPHRQDQPSVVFSWSCSSQKGQASICRPRTEDHQATAFSDSISPLMPTTISVNGIVLPERLSASFNTAVMPPQQGTSIRRTVSVLIGVLPKISVNFST